jgi:hypothetical protein
METERIRKRVRYLLVFFILALVISGLTAVPIKWEIDILQTIIGEGTKMEQVWAPIAHWVSFVHRGLTEISQEYPFMFYGTDWLAFAHIVLALAFLGPLRDPIKNVWVVEFGMIACVLVPPMALVFGPIRGIPLFWRLIDCSFGVVGIIPLWLSRHYIQQLMALEKV